MIDAALHIWLNVAAILVFAGAACYFSLARYMTRD
jgi:hypothetical protein